MNYDFVEVKQTETVQSYSGAAVCFGLWRFGRSLDSCVDQVLAIDGSRMQKELANINGINLTNFDLHSALTKVLEQVGFEVTDGGEWKFWKYVEEVEFGPGLPVHTVFIMRKLLAGD
nr:hypothetical protein CFP56_51296 [Quercus suber]